MAEHTQHNLNEYIATTIEEAATHLAEVWDEAPYGFMPPGSDSFPTASALFMRDLGGIRVASTPSTTKPRHAAVVGMTSELEEDSAAAIVRRFCELAHIPPQHVRYRCYNHSAGTQEQQLETVDIVDKGNTVNTDLEERN